MISLRSFAAYSGLIFFLLLAPAAAMAQLLWWLPPPCSTSICPPELYIAPHFGAEAGPGVYAQELVVHNPSPVYMVTVDAYVYKPMGRGEELHKLGSVTVWPGQTVRKRIDSTPTGKLLHAGAAWLLLRTNAGNANVSVRYWNNLDYLAYSDLDSVPVDCDDGPDPVGDFCDAVF